MFIQPKILILKDSIDNIDNIMWVLLGVSDDTVEKETFVYFIGIFNDLNLATQERDKIQIL